jgi:hypothetical protein
MIAKFWAHFLKEAMIEATVKKKIQELIARAKAHPQTTNGLARDAGQRVACQVWITEALNVVELAVPRPSNAYRRKIEVLSKGAGIISSVNAIAQLLGALLSDSDAGLLGNFADQIRAETFDDFLDQAEAYLKSDRKVESGVIAGVVFEDAVRRVYRNQGHDDKDCKLEDLINTLARDGIISGQQSKQAKVAAHVRTKATHAQWDEFDLQGVTNTIQITRLLLREHLEG